MELDFRSQDGHLAWTDGVGDQHAMLDGIVWVRYNRPGGRIERSILRGDGRVTDEPFADIHGTGRQLTIQGAVNPGGIRLTYHIRRYDHQPFALLQLVIHNLGREGIFMREFCLLQADPGCGGQLIIPGKQDELRFFKVGWHGWDYTGLRRWDERNNPSRLAALTRIIYSNPTTANPMTPGEFWSEGWGILSGADTALIAGFVSTAHQFGQVFARTRKGEQAIALVAQADGILIEPGETCASEWGYLQLVQLPDPDPLVEYTMAVARQMKARVPASPPPAIWTHWYQYYDAINEQLLLQNLDTLDHLRPTIPFEVLELDDGYQAAWGDWTSTNDKFPGGLQWLADTVTANKLKPGLWLAPFTVNAKSRLAREHPGWLVKNEHGKPVTTGFIYSSFMHALDTSNPAVMDYLCELFDPIVHQWGFRMLKLDFLYSAAVSGRRFNPKMTRAECLRSGLESIRQAVGDDTHLLGCGCPFGPAIGLVDAMRVGPDTAFSWEPYLYWLPWAGPLIKKEPSMPSLRNAIRHTLTLSSLHQRWWWNDPDCLLVRDSDSRLTEDEVRSEVTLIGLSGGMVVSSDDLLKVSPERLKWIKLLLPGLGLKGCALDLLENEMPQLYQVKLHSASQEWQLVAIFNWSARPADYRLNFSRLGFKPGAHLHGFDFWAERYFIVVDPELLLESIPPHGCRLLRLCAATADPQLVGDTLHISQGMEITSLTLAGDELVIETIDMGRDIDGELWLSLSIRPRKATSNGEPASIIEAGGSIYRVPVRFHGKTMVIVSWC